MNGNDFTDGFFPAAKVKVLTEGYKTTISYQRPNGKVSESTYHTTPIDDQLLWTISEQVQRVFRKTPLVEIRLPIKDEIAHWEFDNWTSFLSTSQKLHKEGSDLTLKEWVQRINLRTGMKKEFLVEALKYYKNIDA